MPSLNELARRRATEPIIVSCSLYAAGMIGLTFALNALIHSHPQNSNLPPVTATDLQTLGMAVNDIVASPVHTLDTMIKLAGELVSSGYPPHFQPIIQKLLDPSFLSQQFNGGISFGDTVNHASQYVSEAVSHAGKDRLPIPPLDVAQTVGGAALHLLALKKIAKGVLSSARNRLKDEFIWMNGGGSNNLDEDLAPPEVIQDMLDRLDSLEEEVETFASPPEDPIEEDTQAVNTVTPEERLGMVEQDLEVLRQAQIADAQKVRELIDLANATGRVPSPRRGRMWRKPKS